MGPQLGLPSVLLSRSHVSAEVPCCPKTLRLWEPKARPTHLSSVSCLECQRSEVRHQGLLDPSPVPGHLGTPCLLELGRKEYLVGWSHGARASSPGPAWGSWPRACPEMDHFLHFRVILRCIRTPSVFPGRTCDWRKKLGERRQTPDRHPPPPDSALNPSSEKQEVSLC